MSNYPPGVTTDTIDNAYHNWNDDYMCDYCGKIMDADKMLNTDIAPEYIDWPEEVGEVGERVAGQCPDCSGDVYEHSHESDNGPEYNPEDRMES